MWTVDGEKVIERLAGVVDFKVAMASLRPLAWHGHHTEAGCPGDRSADTPETRDIGLALALSDSREALDPLPVFRDRRVPV
jgi:hypothetical protein